MVRATSTVLFTDLVGSTEMSVALGAAFDELRRSHDALLRAAVEGASGQLVKGLGDGVMATFPTVGDGLAAARAAQAAVHRLSRRRGDAGLSIRVGLAVGDVTFEDGDCFGETVIQAARLCAAAEGDQILATAVVRALAGGPRADGFVDVGPLALKGLPEPVEVVEVRWERPTTTSTPLPAHLAVELPSFVGRSPELARLHDAYATVAEGGQRHVVLVGGEPGVGKTTVVSHAIRQWFDAGATVAMGRCDEDVRAPYRPFVDAIGHLVASAPDDLLEEHVARHGPRLLPLAPSLGHRVALPEARSSDPETERHLLFAAAGDLLAALGERAPVVVFLDDLHWADSGTVSLLRSLATAADPARLLIAGTFRSDELAGDHPMGQAMAAFRRVPTVTRLQLGGLGRAEIVELVERWAGADGGPTADRLADDLLAETGGNAFFVTEVVRHLEETGQLSDLAQRPPSRGTLLPESIREVLGERVARLGSVGDGVLAAAAVIGSEFTLPLLSAVTGLGDDKVLGVLDEATAAALVREVGDEPGRFAFTHALVQHAVLANLGATRESALHRRVAELLEADHGGAAVPVAELAHHWLQATTVSDSRRAREWAQQAGDAALAALAPGDAVAYYRQALLLHDQVRDDDVATRIDLLISLGTAERQAGDAEHRDTLLKACRLARRAGDAERLAAAALANNGGTFSTFQGVDVERVAMLEAAIEAGAAPAQQALLLGTLANELTYAGDFERRRRIADDALRAARESGDPSLLLQVSNLVFYAIWVPETLGERLAMTEESVHLIEAVEDPVPRYWAAISNYLNLVQAGRVSEADPLLATMGDLAERLAQPALLWRVRHTHAARLLLAGDPDGAEPLAEEARELGRRAGEPEADVYFTSQATAIRWQRGTLDELAARIKGTSPRPANAMATLCLVFAEGGREDDAGSILDQVAADDLAGLAHDPAFIACAALFAEGAVRLGHGPAAEVLHRHLAPFADQVGFDGVLTVGTLQHHHGGLASVLGRHDEAVDALRRAATIHHSMGAAFFEARSRIELARALRARGRTGDGAAATAELEQAAALARSHRHPAVHQRAQQLLDTTNGA